MHTQVHKCDRVCKLDAGGAEDAVWLWCEQAKYDVAQAGRNDVLNDAHLQPNTPCQVCARARAREREGTQRPTVLASGTKGKHKYSQTQRVGEYVCACARVKEQPPKLRGRRCYVQRVPVGCGEMW